MIGRNAQGATPAALEERFTELMNGHGQAVLGYLARRAAPAHEAADLMAEVFTVAWRRVQELPDDEQQVRAWLIGVSRGVLTNHHRTAARRTRLTERFGAHLHTQPQQVNNASDHGAAVREALRQLSDDDRELLTLLAWEELTSEQAAVVLGTSAAAVRKRLQRARGRLRGLIAVEEAPPDFPQASLSSSS